VKRMVRHPYYLCQKKWEPRWAPFKEEERKKDVEHHQQDKPPRPRGGKKGKKEGKSMIHGREEKESGTTSLSDKKGRGLPLLHLRKERKREKKTSRKRRKGEFLLLLSEGRKEGRPLPPCLLEVGKKKLSTQKKKKYWPRPSLVASRRKKRKKVGTRAHCAFQRREKECRIRGGEGPERHFRRLGGEKKKKKENTLLSTAAQKEGRGGEKETL